MSSEGKEKVSRFEQREYNLTREERAELRRVLAKIMGRKVTGTLTVDLGEGGINRVRLLESGDRN